VTTTVTTADVAAPAAVTARPTTVSGGEAKKVTGINWYGLLKLAALGKIRVQAEPGSALSFVAEDIEALARELGR
jgi:hypothetical protein